MPDLDATARRVLGIFMLVIALALIVLTLSWCSERRRVGAAQAGQTFAEARTGAAADENKAGVVRSTEQRTINETVGAGTDAIRKAPDRVSGGRATLRSLCDLDSSDSRCRVFDPR